MKEHAARGGEKSSRSLPPPGLPHQRKRREAIAVLLVVFLPLVDVQVVLEEPSPERLIPLAFHTMPMSDLERVLGGSEQRKTKQQVEGIIDDLVESVNRIWSAARISFLKAKTVWGDAPTAPSRSDRSSARQRANEEQPHFYHVFLVEGPFLDYPGAQGLTVESWGTFLSCEGWTNDPNLPDDDDDPTNGWVGEEAPGEVLAHELGHALGLLPGQPGKLLRHYRGDKLRERLMHEDVPCGTVLSSSDIATARESRLVRKFEAAALDDTHDRTTNLPATEADRRDITAAIATVGTYELRGSLTFTILVDEPIPRTKELEPEHGCPPQVLGEARAVSYHVVIDVDVGSNRGASDTSGLWRGAEVDASVNYKVGVGWSSVLRLRCEKSRWRKAGTFPFEVALSPGLVTIHVPMELANLAPNLSVAWKAFVVEETRSVTTVDVVPERGSVVMDLDPVLLKPPEASLHHATENRSVTTFESSNLTSGETSVLTIVSEEPVSLQLAAPIVLSLALVACIISLRKASNRSRQHTHLSPRWDRSQSIGRPLRLRQNQARRHTDLNFYLRPGAT